MWAQTQSCVWWLMIFRRGPVLFKKKTRDIIGLATAGDWVGLVSTHFLGNLKTQKLTVISIFSWLYTFEVSRGFIEFIAIFRFYYIQYPSKLCLPNESSPSDFSSLLSTSRSCFTTTRIRTLHPRPSSSHFLPRTCVLPLLRTTVSDLWSFRQPDQEPTRTHTSLPHCHH